MLRVGLISDTHGLLRPEAVAFLRGSDFIVHAGDVGDATVIDKLRELAPVTVNPGSAGPRRFKLPLSVGELRIEGSSVTSRHVELQSGDKA